MPKAWVQNALRILYKWNYVRNVYLFRFCINFDVTNVMQYSFKPLILADEFKQQESGFNAIMKPTAKHVSAYESYLN
jgi:hypothetical protein